MSQGVGDRAKEEVTRMFQEYPSVVACLLDAQGVDRRTLADPTPSLNSRGEPYPQATIFDAVRGGENVKVEIIDWSRGRGLDNSTSSGSVHVSVWDPRVPPEKRGNSLIQPRTEISVAGRPDTGNEGGQYVRTLLVGSRGESSYSITEAIRNVQGMRDGEIKYTNSTAPVAEVPEHGIPERVREMHERARCFGG